ncbi:outer membrane protein assembly factor BamB family protein [Neobacillus drentensis]|uniref:outer membrane protein assembly factor BamB family protein n=1 Tax=Neobacillus drentensis TaxID=220684 RepID=UPI0030013E5E
MRFIGKWFGSLFVLALIMLVLPSLQANASTTTKFYQDGTCTDCFTSLYTGANGNVYQLQYETGKINALSSEGKRLWSYDFPKDHYLVVGGRGEQAMDAKGNFYIGVENNGFSNQNGVYLASLNSKGKLNWQFKLENGGPARPLIGTDGTVYFGSGNHTDYIGPYSESTFYAVSSKGKKKWSVKLKGDAFGSTSTFDSKQNIVIHTNNDEGAWKYTISKTGKILSEKETSTYAAFLDKSENSYGIDYNSNSLVVTSKSGKKLWSYKGKEGIGIGHVTAGGTVILSNDSYTLSITKGKVNWKTKVTGSVVSSSQGLYVLNNEMNWDTNTGKLRIYLLDSKSGKIKYSSTQNFYSFQTAVHPKGYVLVSKNRTIYKVALFKEKSPALKSGQVKLTNNKSKSDTVKVTGLKKGDTIKIYNASSKGKLLATKKASSSSTTISIKQLGKKAGKVYLTVTRTGMSESSRTAVAFKSEKK